MTSDTWKIVLLFSSIILKGQSHQRRSEKMVDGMIGRCCHYPQYHVKSLINLSFSFLILTEIEWREEFKGRSSVFWFRSIHIIRFRHIKIYLFLLPIIRITQIWSLDYESLRRLNLGYSWQLFIGKTLWQGDRIT
jgi:hypothetical protein